MKLVKVVIEGFRSIEKMELEFDGTGHKILVGKNESGKSNILKALNLLEREKSFDTTDKKIMYHEKSEVRFYFKLSDEKIDELKNQFCKEFCADGNDTLTENLTIEEFFKECLRYICYTKKADVEDAWDIEPLDPKLKLVGNWFYAVFYSGTPYNPSSDEAELFFTEKQLGNDGITPINVPYEESTKGKVNLKNIHDDLRRLFKGSDAFPVANPPVINWKYNSQEHGLRPYINKIEFSENPDSCIPLRNIFILSGISTDDIAQRIDAANLLGPNGIKNLYRSISRKINSYIKQKWTEYDKVKMSLTQDSENILIGIDESSNSNSFDFQQRSDGFRRFVSFLLSIDPRINNSGFLTPLILIDEPESGLHPSAARDLKNRIIELGKDSLIVYATHSISMIDTDNIGNNLIILKENENTIFKKPIEDGTSPGENIYHAIGYSIYHEFKKMNVLLEGYTDKKILKLFMVANGWDKYGICFTNGVGNINHVMSTLELGNRKYFVLSDSDEAAYKERDKTIDPRCWFTYEDLGSKAVTLEDFYKKDFFEKIVNEIAQQSDVTLEQDAWFTEDNRIAKLKKHIQEMHSDDESKKDKAETVIKAIKNKCAEEAKTKDVDEGKLQPVLDKFLKEIKKKA